MLKKTFLLMLSVFAILPFAGQVSAATQDVKASDDLAWFWGGWGRGWGYGNYGYGCSYGSCGSYSYYPYYGYGYGCGYGGCY